MGLLDRLRDRLTPSGGISVDEALLLLAKGGVLVDVRTPGEYEAGHAPGARLVDPRELAADPWTAVHGDNPLAEPDGTFVLMCDIGLRSGTLVQNVREKGYRAEFIAGGLGAWARAGETVLKGPPRRR